MDTFELYRQEGKSFRSVRVGFDEKQFRIDTQDMGDTVEQLMGDCDYEFWTSVPKESWGDLLVAFTKEFLSGDDKATDTLRDICKKPWCRAYLG